MPTHALLTATWWAAAGRRAAYTALAALLPLAALLVAREVTVEHVLLVVALALVASLVTSLAGLPEVDGRAVPAWLAVLVRVTKTAAQTLAANLGGALILTDVDWPTVGTAVAGAALTTLVRTLMSSYLPEEDPGEVLADAVLEACEECGRTDGALLLLPDGQGEVVHAECAADIEPDWPDHDERR